MTGWKGSSRLTLDSQSIIGGMADIIVMPCWLLWRRYTASSDQRPARAHRDSDDPLLGQRTQPETVHEGGQEHHEQSYEGSHIPYTVSLSSMNKLQLTYELALEESRKSWLWQTDPLPSCDELFFQSAFLVCLDLQYFPGSDEPLKLPHQSSATGTGNAALQLLLTCHCFCVQVFVRDFTSPPFCLQALMPNIPSTVTGVMTTQNTETLSAERRPWRALRLNFHFSLNPRR